MTDARYTYTAGMPAARVGWLVARARAVAGITDRDLASSLILPLRTIRRWERGDLVPTDDEVEAIAAACGIRLTELLPRRASVSYDPSTGIMRMGDQAVALPGTMLDNDTVLGAYIGMVRRQRGLRPDQDVKVRQEDLEALAEALDLDDEELEERLVRVIGMSRTQAAAVRAQLLRRRLAVPMVGMLAGLSLLGINRLFTTATEQVKTVAGGAITRGNPFAESPTTTATTIVDPVTVKSPDTSAATAPSATGTPTLPPVVTEDTVVEPTLPSRTGPPRSTRQRTPATDSARLGPGPDGHRSAADHGDDRRADHDDGRHLPDAHAAAHGDAHRDAGGPGDDHAAPHHDDHGAGRDHHDDDAGRHHHDTHDADNGRRRQHDRDDRGPAASAGLQPAGRDLARRRLSRSVRNCAPASAG